MALAVVNYPTLSNEDQAWIQTVREEHDKLYFHVIDPHFTLVFPTENIDQALLIEHVRKRVDSFEPFEVVFRCAIVGDPDFQEHAHVFLVPDEGFSEVVKLHDRLYMGLLRPELRLDLPFLPHVGIANAREVETCKDLVDALNAENFEIRGKVEQLEVIGYDGAKVWTLERITLGWG